MLDEEQLAAVSERLQSGKPAVVTLPEIPANLEGSLLFKVPVRYGGRLLAPHLLGYMDGDGLHGLTGVELAFDEYLNSCGGQASVTYSVDAMASRCRGSRPRWSTPWLTPRPAWCSPSIRISRKSRRKRRKGT